MGSNFTPLTMDSALLVNMGGRGGSASPYDQRKKEKKNCEDFGSWGGRTTPVAHGDGSTTSMAKEREKK
jgi:hypothetical protein